MFRMKRCALIAVVVLAVAQTALAAGKPLKVYIMAGQSNMQGKAQPKTLPAMAKDPKSKALHDKMVDSDGNPRVYEDVFISYLTSAKGVSKTEHGPLHVGEGSFGPELGFGIKTAWGGRSLCVQFRPPSAEPYQVQPSVVEYMKSHNLMEKLERSLAGTRKKSGVYYDKMMEHVKKVLADPGKYHPAYDPKEGYELAGFVWFQGYNDMIDSHTYKTKGPDAYKKYSRLFAHFIRDVRKDLDAPHLPFVIGVLGLGGVTDGPFQEAQAAPADMPEFKDNVVAVRTGKYWDQKLGELDKRMVDKVIKPHGRQSKGLDRDEARKLREKLIKENFTDEELKRLETGRSNAGFHYLGSAKIYSQIGEAFAEALLELKKN